ncbi:eIF-2-alpha kinase GCN2-like [Acropora palmata]|uniref:eIF-2-alpha kinase GCN2-like n=1 Tax=Acropora palmata TaxID=6131 RepID=UPI003DA05993
MEETCKERQENELQAIQAIYMDDFQDLREKREDPPKVCLNLTPLQSVVGKEVYARVDLIVQYTKHYPNKSPKLSLSNAKGISNEDVSELQKELQQMAAELVGEVMVLNLAHHVQTFLHTRNKPQLSFYEKMMVNKKEEEERLQAAEQEKRLMEFEAKKEREENEKREIEEVLQRREEAVKESRRRRVITEQNSKTNPSQLSANTNNTDLSPAKESSPLQRKASGNSLALCQHPTASPKKTDAIKVAPARSILRRRRSSECIGDEVSFSGTQVITFKSKSERVVHAGKCLGQGSSGSRVFSAMDISLGELVVVCEWSLSSQQGGAKRSLLSNDNQQLDSHGGLMKQVCSIEQEIVSGLVNRVSHPNLTHYLAVNVQETVPFVKVQVLVEYVGGGDLSLRLRSGGLPVRELREYTQQLVEAITYLHGKHVVHKDLRLTSCRFDSGGNLRLADYSVGKRYILLKLRQEKNLEVRNRLDNCLYAVKRIPLKPKSVQFTKRITREVQLISRLNHENVVRYYNAWIESSEEQSSSSNSTDTDSASKNKPVEDSLLELNKIEAPSLRPDRQSGLESWWKDGEESSKDGSDSSSSGSQDSVRSPQKSHSTSFFSSKSKSSERIVFDTAKIDESVLQFGDLMDTESEDSEEGEDWQETESDSSLEVKGLQYLYIQMEYCEKSTLRNLIDEGLHQDEECVWRLFREIVEGLAHIHTQGIIIHRDLKPVNLFLDSHGRVKIGDFGLATTHSIMRVGMGTDTPENNDNSQSSKSSASAKESVTGKVGTFLYVAPELGKRGNLRAKYSPKVDLYSLGIIFFEMCFRPLTTSMERVEVLGNLRTERTIFPGEFDQKQLAKQTTVLKWLLKHNPEERPSSQELLQSQYIPPKIEDGQLDEVLEHTLASTNSTRYQRLMKAVFSQHVYPVREVTYDVEFYTRQVFPRTILAQQMVHESVKSVFVRHGALRVRTPLLAPRTKLFEELELAVSLMDHSGALVMLPYDLRIPFARYVARKGVLQMKRFDVGCVYRVNRFLGAHPREIYECVFDIITSTTEDLVPDAEVLLVVAEIIREFPCLDNRDYYIRINHTGLMKSFLSSHCVSDERQSELISILQEPLGEKERNDQISSFVENLQISEHNATALCEFLNFNGPVNKLREHLIATRKRKSWIGQTARQAFSDLEKITSHAKKFVISLPVVVNTSMVYNFQHFSGLIFQFVAADSRKRKRGGVDILAAGGRYDKLIGQFRRVADTSCGVGVSIAIEKIVSALVEDQEAFVPCQYDVFVCSTGSKPLQEESMHIARDLWNAGIKATISYGAILLEEAQEVCKREGIQHMVVLKDLDPGFVRVRSLDRERVSESRVQISELVDHLHGKCSGKPEVAECNAPPSNKCQGTQGSNEPSSIIAPEIKVSFNTQEKMAWNTKRRYESVMVAKIKPLFAQFSSKNAVEVIGVDLPGSVLRNMSAILDLDANKDAFDASVATIEDKSPRHRRYIERVCEEIRELKVIKKVPMVFVYSVKDDIFKTFF